jgi:hypothetical protein
LISQVPLRKTFRNKVPAIIFSLGFLFLSYSQDNLREPYILRISGYKKRLLEEKRAIE